ncbi:MULTISPECIES: HAD family phosphatase [unclassified Phyllobacterium]|uniref:HAD family hydrolase n=1 Tax=Phyllobacterium TaxID=28100 RepID=UPI000DD9BCA8|nr:MULTISPECIES: HAD family phosphatase [unclassified Phyllobacterium]MBA8901495.1 HAD superfamily hydrolase (TIGR01509 family) [Phyllobacterium sp. P30BS-XVII]UGX84894.1 HAD family phosphatase [Phyllobacterium sp. T1293]
MEPQLIIFDCDGVLVDSEILAAEVESKLLTESGYPIEPEVLAERFAGLTWTDILIQVEKESGVPISASLIEETTRQMDHKLRNELNVIDGIEQVVAALKYPKCIASNSTSAALKMMLEQSTLYDLFAPNIFSAREVGSQKPKPAPDVFLFAAKHFNVEPARCIVIEDSSHGVHAAATAGMRVIGFTGGAHTYPGHADKLTDAGAETVISRHRDLPAVLDAMAVWSEAV